MNKQELRQKLRALRNAVPIEERLTAANNLCSLATTLPVYTAAQHVAFYWPNQNEIDCLPLLNHTLKQAKKCYLPLLVLKNRQSLAFASYDSQTPMLKNRYGILEPDSSYAVLIDPIELDIIFVPVVGFDNKGWRLGRGGGYYDATFADLHRTQSKKLPKLIGLAYECQRIDSIPIDSWDWQLDAVITESQIYNFNAIKG